jgi:hypothetical protein
VFKIIFSHEPSLTLTFAVKMLHRINSGCVVMPLSLPICSRAKELAARSASCAGRTRKVAPQR